MATIRVYGIEPESIVDGPGLRYALFVQGCSHKCPGCHNPESHSADGGTAYEVSQLFDDIQAHRLVKRVTFSGGEPFEQAEGLLELARLVKNAGYDLWVYTGYLYENLRKVPKDTPRGAAVAELLGLTDVLVDGPYIEGLRSLELTWRGSANQRVIDLARMRAADNMDVCIPWEDASGVQDELLRRPTSW